MPRRSLARGMAQAPAWGFEEVSAGELAAFEAAEARALASRGGAAKAARTEAPQLSRAPLAQLQPDAADSRTAPPSACVAAPAAAPLAGAAAAQQQPPHLLRFRGRVETAATAAEVDAAVGAVYAGAHAAVGWDIEWPVSFVKGAAPQRAALMQLALDGSAAGGPPVVFLLQLAHAGLTPALARLLADPAVLKAGCGARNDAHKIARDFGVACAGVTDLSDYAAARLAPAQRWSLAALTARVLGSQLPKPPAVRLGAWDARRLTHEQTAYAALDAWASLRVYAALQRLPLLPQPPLAAPYAGGGAGGADGAAAADGACVPAVEAPVALAPTKREVHAQHCGGATAAQIAAARGIKIITVENYLCDAMCAPARDCAAPGTPRRCACMHARAARRVRLTLRPRSTRSAAGHAYNWQLLGVDDAATAAVDAALAEEAQQPPPPTAAAAPAEAAAAPAATAAAAPLSATAAAAAAEAALRARLHALKARLPESVSFGTLRLVVAHRARQNGAGV